MGRFHDFVRSMHVDHYLDQVASDVVLTNGQGQLFVIIILLLEFFSPLGRSFVDWPQWTLPINLHTYLSCSLI